MKREDFIKIIKLRSFWKIDKRKGNYLLPNGEKLSKYIDILVEGQLRLDKLAIAEDGNLYDCNHYLDDKNALDDYVIYRPFSKDEICSYDKQEERINIIVSEIVGI